MSPTSGFVCECRNLYVSHNPQVENPNMVLQDINLAVAPGEMVSIVGPSGGGKSTLLYTLAGFTRPYHGTTELLGRCTTKASQRQISAIHRAGVGFVFQQYNLIPSLPTIDNVTLPRRFAGRRIDKKYASLLLEQMGLGAEITKRTGDLSGGQQQRVAVARVIYSQPSLVFADEPTGALDSHNGSIILDALESLAQAGSAVLLVTHDLQAAARADRAITLRDGQVQRIFVNPTADELFAGSLLGSQHV